MSKLLRERKLMDLKFYRIETTCIVSLQYISKVNGF